MTDFSAAARTAAAAFSLPLASLEAVAVSENITFRAVDARDGAAWSLRLHRPGYNSLAELESERVWTAALAAGGIAAPEGMKTPQGCDFAFIANRYAGLTRWTDGEVLGAEAPADAFAALGRLIARLHAFDELWAAPAGFTRRRIDADGLMGPEPNWGRFWEHPALTHSEAALLAGARVRLHARLAALPRTRREFGLIHADLHGGNAVRAPDGALHVIDFDDAGYGWRLYDLAVACHPLEGLAGGADRIHAIVDAYGEDRPLTAADTELLQVFVLVRSLAVIGWLGQRPEMNPGVRLAQLINRACQGCVELGFA